MFYAFGLLFYHVVQLILLSVKFWLKRKETFEVHGSPQDVVFFIESYNEYLAVVGVANKLVNEGVKVAITGGGAGCVPVGIDKRIELISSIAPRGEPIAILVMLVLRLPYTVGSLLRVNRAFYTTKKGVFSVINCYRRIVRSVAFFTEYRPSLVVLANDHVPGPRAFRLVAEHFGVKTAYVQHACVNHEFPILSFDYAFLDGRFAHESYNESNFGLSNQYLRARKENCIVFYTGQQKEVAVSNERSLTRNVALGKTIGIAINLLSNSLAVRELIRHLSRRNFSVILRLHPRQDRNAYDINEMDRVSCRHATDQPLSEFFSEIDVLLAGNSSILLEAALAGLPVAMVEIDQLPVDCQDDVYGFEKRGLVKKVCIKNTDDVASLDEINPPSKELLRGFSETYGTIWQGKESTLVSSVIQDIISFNQTACADKIGFMAKCKGSFGDFYIPVHCRHTRLF